MSGREPLINQEPPKGGHGDGKFNTHTHEGKARDMTTINNKYFMNGQQTPLCLQIRYYLRLFLKVTQSTSGSAESFEHAQ